MLRSTLIPNAPEPKTVHALADVIAQIEAAFEHNTSLDALMDQHNKLAGRTDIPVSRYEELYSSMSPEEAAQEALMPVPFQVSDITRAELEDIAARIQSGDTPAAEAYYLSLFEMNTLSGNSDLFYWPDRDWLAGLGTNDPTPAMIVDRAMIALPGAPGS